MCSPFGCHVSRPINSSGMAQERTSRTRSGTVVRRTGPTPRLKIEPEFARLTHYLFRYPAKFHPPVVRALISRYTQKGGVVLDPFCGSGTLLVEAAALGRSSIGTDLDPVATAVAKAKVHRYGPTLERSAAQVLQSVQKCRRPAAEYERRMFDDLTDAQYEREIARLQSAIPAIPNLLHWFRRYVVVDLARLRRAIDKAHMPESHRHLIRVVFGSIIRNASNADPVPVSGLEVTSHMKKRDEAGRLIDPFGLFERALQQALNACRQFSAAVDPGVFARVLRADATALPRGVGDDVDAVITSPPYHGAVDYYRRHQLEMFWLGLVDTHEDRLALLPAYIGRPKVPASHPFVSTTEPTTALVRQWEVRIRAVSEERANAFRHYAIAMTRFFASLAKRVRAGTPVVLVVGHSSWNSVKLPTTAIFTEVAGAQFGLDDVFSYPVKNRYMSYSRHNDASIDREYVLVLKRA